MRKLCLLLVDLFLLVTLVSCGNSYVSSLENGISEGRQDFLYGISSGSKTFQEVKKRLVYFMDKITEDIDITKFSDWETSEYEVDDIQSMVE